MDQFKFFKNDMESGGQIGLRLICFSRLLVTMDVEPWLRIKLGLFSGSYFSDFKKIVAALTSGRGCSNITKKKPKSSAVIVRIGGAGCLKARPSPPVRIITIIRWYH